MEKATLKIRCVIRGLDGRESVCWYKLKGFELKEIETETVVETNDRNTYPRYRYTQEPTLESIDRLFKVDDTIAVRYIPDKPKFCVILSKV